MIDLAGRVALVTGASRGVGAAAAKALAEAGARVIVTDISDTADVAAGIDGLDFRLDVSSEDNWIEAIAFARKEAGGLDILVNNAGMFLMKSVVETTLEEWRRIHAVNLEGAFLGCKHAVPLIAERAMQWAGGGAIVNISSAAGLVGGANYAAYTSTKGAVRLMSKSLAIELAPRKIRVNSVHPGLVDTQMGDQVISDFSKASGVGNNEARTMFATSHPLGHAASPANIADGIAFLASDRAAFITGTELVIDGGMTAQ